MLICGLDQRTALSYSVQNLELQQKKTKKQIRLSCVNNDRQKNEPTWQQDEISLKFFSSTTVLLSGLIRFTSKRPTCAKHINTDSFKALKGIHPPEHSDSSPSFSVFYCGFDCPTKKCGMEVNWAENIATTIFALWPSELILSLQVSWVISASFAHLESFVFVKQLKFSQVEWKAFLLILSHEYTLMWIIPSQPWLHVYSCDLTRRWSSPPVFLTYCSLQQVFFWGCSVFSNLLKNPHIIMLSSPYFWHLQSDMQHYFTTTHTSFCMQFEVQFCFNLPIASPSRMLQYFLWQLQHYWLLQNVAKLPIF